MTQNKGRLTRLAVLLFVALALISIANAQTASCTFTGSFSSATTSPTFDNRTRPNCNAWAVTYYSSGFSALSVQLEGAPDNAGTPGTWTAFSGATVVLLGSNPSTALQSVIKIAAYTPWVRLHVTSVTGTGSITWQVYGYFGTTAALGTSGGGGGGTVTGVTASDPLISSGGTTPNISARVSGASVGNSIVMLASGAPPSNGDCAVWQVTGANAYLGDVGAACSPAPAIYTVGTGGVTINTLVCLSNNTVVTCGNGTGTSAPAVLGVSLGTRTAGSSVSTSQPQAQTSCVFENAVTANDIVTSGTTTAGDCRDTGQTSLTALATNVPVVGVALTSGAAGSTQQITFFGPGTTGGLLSAAGVTSFNTRTGAVTPATADYTAAQVTNAVSTAAANTGGAGMTLDMSASTTANAYKVPVSAGATATANGAIAYDSTNNNLHAAQGGADAKVATFTATPGNGNCANWSVSGGTIKLGDAGAVCGSGGIGAAYVTPASTSPLTISAATHGQGTSPAIGCYDGAVVSGAVSGNVVQCAVHNDGAGNLLVYFSAGAIQSVVVSGSGSGATEPFCSSTVTVNCVLTANAQGNVTIGTTVPPAGATNAVAGALYSPYTAATAYTVGAMVTGSDGNVYRALVTTTGNNPTADGGSNWELATANANTTLNVPSRFATFGAAWNFLQNSQIGQGYTVTVQFADGTYSFGATRFSLNHPQGSQIAILGNTTTRANVVLNFSGPASPFTGYIQPDWAFWHITNGHNIGRIDGFTINGPGMAASNAIGAMAISAFNASSVSVGPHVTINNAYAGVAAFFSSTIWADGITVTGGGDGNIWAYSGSTISCDSCTSSGAITYFSRSGVLVDNFSYIFATNMTITGNGGSGISLFNGSVVKTDGTTISGSPSGISSQGINNIEGYPASNSAGFTGSVNSLMVDPLGLEALTSVFILANPAVSYGNRGLATTTGYLRNTVQQQSSNKIACDARDGDRGICFQINGSGPFTYDHVDKDSSGTPVIFQEWLDGTGRVGELHPIGIGSTPAITSGFGTSPSIVGTDSAGRLTVGSGGSATTGVITFAKSWSTAPACTANDETTLLLVQATTSTTTLTLTSATAWTAADKITWNCRGF